MFREKELTLTDEKVRKSLGLTKTDYKIFDFLMQNSYEWFTSELISSRTEHSLLTVRKSLKKLRAEKMIKKNKHGLACGGCLYAYRVKNKGTIKKKIVDSIRTWTEQFEQELETW